MKTALLFMNLRRFNALLPSLSLLLIAVAMAWSALQTIKPDTPKTVLPPGHTENLLSDVLELRKLDNDLDLGPKLVLLKVVSKKKNASAYEIKGIYVEAVAKSSEKKASGFHLSSIYLVAADGSGLKKVLSDVDEVLSRRNDANKLRLIYQKQNSVRMAQIDMQDFKVLADRELAKMSEFKK